MMTTDILVVGLGPAGAAAAEAAARVGARVIAVDRRAVPGLPVQCAEFVPSLIGQATSAYRQAQRQGIAGMITVTPGGTDHQDTFRGAMIDRAAFDAALVARARDAGADCRFATVLRALNPDGTAALSSGETIKPRVIIGADGPRSTVGAAIGRTNRELAETRQITVPLRQPFATTDIYLSPDIIGGYAWLFPSGDVAHLGLGVEQSHRATLKPLLERLRADLIREGRIGDTILRHTGGALPVGGLVDPVASLGTTPVLLAGDACGLANPITGAGIASAVQSGQLAGAAAARAVAGDPRAAAGYGDDIEDLFSVALARATRRRHELLAIASARALNESDLRRGWIAYPEYWTEHPNVAAATNNRIMADA